LRSRRGRRRRPALGLLAALLLAVGVDVGMWALRHGGSGWQVNNPDHGHVPSPLLTAAYSNGLLVGAGRQAAYALFWNNAHGKLQGQIWQWMIEPPGLPGQKVPGTYDTADGFTGTVVGSRVTIRLAGNGLNGGVSLITGRIRNGRLLSLSDPVAGHGAIAFRTEKNLNRFTALWNRMYYGEWNRLHRRPR
jgi:hypothetical protein